jgi:hypothetical protein
LTVRRYFGIEANTLAELQGKAFNLPLEIYNIEDPGEKIAYLQDAMRQIEAGKISEKFRAAILEANRWTELPGEK